ncbi:glycosyltransferase [Phaeobacter sp. 22II1-1F12B]|uniref:glycosyltransferase family 2 protein n=1 Tax=Phaeobacter sp. 22II1-1F12B TaxID=1317111 RepID=UPI000B5225FA|nr:glycosyltransferase [Phaeobacter sp. 22II1-1F12B]OWU77050.1 hypothetical protein ATO1_15465 [Phaeobacter sp. 22II1-1F12B]
MRVSIIIPTRERAFYLRHCLQTVLDIDDDDIEIIVSNNASTDDTDEVLAEIKDPRLKVINTGTRISMRQNFEFSLSHATGDYIIYIGDDDAFIPQQFSVFREVIEHFQPDSLSWSIPTFGWVTDNYSGKNGGVRFEKKFLFGALEQIDMKAMKSKLLQADYEDFRAPTIYHGAASRAFMEKNRAANGVFFNGTSPDLYFTDLAVFQNARHFDLRHPITISGKSAASTGAAHNSKAIKKDASNPAARFAAENNADQMRDVADFGTSVRGAFFQVMETVRHILEVEEKPDYAAWFRFVLADHKGHGVEEQQDVIRRLREYAAIKGESEILEKLISEGVSDVSRKRLAARWEKAKSKLQSFRIKTELDGENTVLTAARVADIILGNDYSATAQNNRDRLWKEAVKRSKPFPRQF